MSAFSHAPVLLEESIRGLQIHPDGIYLDGTVGGAGHALAIAETLTTGRLLGIDRDQSALDAAAVRLAPYQDHITLIHSNFGVLDSILEELGVTYVDGMIFDLGVSSPQLDNAERGFSYSFDAPLDMRMNRDDSLTAYEIVNQWPKAELQRILYAYGEERYAPQIAAAIDRKRQFQPIETTMELAEIVRSAMPSKALREKQHPAKRSFQAIRIAVNQELQELQAMLETAIPHLAAGGRLAVITFHSLEDRIVKTAMQTAAKGCTCPPELPVCVCGKTPQVKILTRKPITAGPEELKQNPRARSAKLRICEKL